jgi:hypothetical protein
MVAGAIISAAGAIIGGLLSARAAKKNRKLAEAARQRSQQWYDREYNADYTQRADSQAALNHARSILDSKYRQAQGASAVAGATDESVAQQKAAANNALGEITSNIAARADAYKERVRANYESGQAAADQADMESNSQMAQNIAKSASGLVNAAGSAESKPW